MESNYTEKERYYQAHKKVEEIKKFYQHLAVYILCNPIIIVVNLMTSPGYLYFWWCLFGWGFGLAMHGMKAFDFSPLFNKKWEERKIKEILEKENKKQKWE